MIVVRVELHSAITRKVTELARMRICNIGGTTTVGSYSVETLRGRSRESLDRGIGQRAGQVKDYPKLRLHVWHLVARALVAMRYAGAEVEQQGDLLEEAGR